MKVAVIGAGYVGLVTATCLSDLGNEVICVDQDFGRIALLQAGGIPLYEPGLDELVRRNLEAQRLRFTTSLAQAVQQSESIFISVGTPPQEDGSADLQHVLEVAHQIGRHMDGFKVVINKSTVPVGTAQKVRHVIAAELAHRDLRSVEFAVVSNPEFLKEGAAIEDFMRPDRIVVGVPSGPVGERARLVLSRLYAPFNRHHERTLWMDVESAELTKYAANAMLATRISFMNEMAKLADAVGADIDAVRRGIGADQRIGPSFLYAGTGYGGSCFPKDTRALSHTAAQFGLSMNIVDAVEAVNRTQKGLLVRHLETWFGRDLKGRRLAVWGLAFKPNTNDMREAPSREVIAELLKRGAELVVFDPVATDEAARALSQDLNTPVTEIKQLHFAQNPMQALTETDALLVLTEWKCFLNPDFQAMRERMRTPLILDGRNVYDPQVMEEMGFMYVGIGRRNARARAAMHRQSMLAETLAPVAPLAHPVSAAGSSA